MHWRKVVAHIRQLVKRPLFYFCMALIILNLYFTKQALREAEAGGFALIAAMELAVEGGAFFVLYKMRQKALPLEKQFLFVAVLLGAFFIVLLPPGQAPDDGAHFMRAYGIAEGHLISEQIDEASVGGSIPTETDFILDYAGYATDGHGTYQKVWEQLWRTPSGETTVRQFNTSSVYNFVNYIPQSMGILVGKILGCSVLTMAYLAKIFNFILWVVLVYFGIKLIPRFKTLLIFMALLPITLQEATSMSPDALAIGLGIFIVSYVLYLTHTKSGLLSKKEKLLLGVLAIAMSLCKIVYLPMVLLYLILPVERFGTKRKKWLFLISVGLVAVTVNLAWLLISFKFILETNPGVDAKAQALWVLTHPLNYLGVIVNSVNLSSLQWTQEALGIWLTTFNIGLPMLFFFPSLIILVLILAQGDEPLKVTVFDKVVGGLVFVATIGLILTSLYVQWTPYGGDTIGGIQGRYFLPILPIVPLLLCKTSGKRKTVLVSNQAPLYYGVLLGVLALVTIFVKNI